MKLLCRIFGHNHASIHYEPIEYGVCGVHFQCGRCVHTWTEILQTQDTKLADFWAGLDG